MIRRTAFAALIIALALCIGLGLMQSGTTQAAGPPQIVSGFGQATIDGERTIVHVVVVASPGQSGQAAVDQALADHGARPFDSAAFTFDGIVWDGNGSGPLGVGPQQNYNPANAQFDAAAVLVAAQTPWNNVDGSSFSFIDGIPETNRLPSLVKETPGRQFYDGKNDIAWMELKSRGTLAVTWFGTSTDEADIAINTRYNWFDGTAPDPISGDYDLLTVMLHENGHVVRLGHSDVDTGGTDGKAVMWPSYNRVVWTLLQDDIDGVLALYGEPVPPPPTTTGSISGTVTASDGGAAIEGASVETDTGQSAGTDVNGNYTISGVPTGSRTVTASASGYDDLSASATVTDGVTTANVNFALATTVGPLPVATVTVDIDGDSFGNKDRVDIVVTALDAGDNPVVGAAASVTVAAPNRTLGASGVTDSNGQFSTWYKVNKGRDGTGTYVVTGTVDGVPGSASFEVN